MKDLKWVKDPVKDILEQVSELKCGTVGICEGGVGICEINCPTVIFDGDHGQNSAVTPEL